MTCSDTMKAGETHIPDAPRVRILFVTQHLPVPVRGGSSQRSHVLLEALSAFADVEVLAVGSPGVRTLLEDNGYRVAGIIPPESEGGLAVIARLLGLLFPERFRYHPRAIATRALKELWASGRYDIAVGRYCRPSARGGVHEIQPAIVDIDDLESQKLSSWIASHRLAPLVGPLGEWLVRRVQRAERKVIANLSCAWLSAAEDLADLPARHVTVIPNIPFYAAAATHVPSPASDSVLFVASFDYRVNVNALRRLVQSVWPRVHAERPDLMLCVVGGGLSEDMRALLARTPGVDYAGFVDDLTAEYARALFSVVPIWEGGGSKIKILESLALGRSCVVAAPSMRGYGEHLHDGEQVMVAEDEDMFVASILRLASDSDLRHRLEKSGCVAVTAHFSRTVLAAHVRTSVEQVLGVQR